MHMAVHQFPHLHDHELIFEDEHKLDTDYVKMKFCEICGFLMFINASYSCREKGCNFSIHKECAELPEKKVFVFDTTTYRLSLTPNKDTIDKRCIKCFQICNNFTYSTLGRYQNFHFHPFCVERKEIKTKHRSHQEHPMTPTHKEISAGCDACGVDDKKDHFLLCQSCNYWIHKDCALLPHVGMHTSHANHPLILLYSNPFSRRRSYLGDDGKCKICKKDLPIQNAAYMCQACRYFVHLKCVRSKIEPLSPQESSKHVVVLPPAAMEYYVFPSFVIRKEQQEIMNDNQTGYVLFSKSSKHLNVLPPAEEEYDVFPIFAIGKEQKKKCHEHPLTSHDNKKKYFRKRLTMEVCNACVQPISSSCKYYSCSKARCRFLVHEVCANLPKTITRKFIDREIHLFTERASFFRTFNCDICDRMCNGFGYLSDSWWRSIIADVECASAPRIIRHQSHHHHLHLIKWERYDNIPGVSCCQQRRSNRFLYICISCDFKIHISCALLPKKVSHEFDDHPLQLITNPNNLQKSSDDKDKNQDRLFCEFCEEDINLEFCEEDINREFWYYKCDKCDQSFHVACIPSVGKLSKFKFGGTLDDVPCHLHHPLTSVPILTIGNQTCGYCNGIIDGFRNDIAFQCSECDFWIHWGCADKSRGSKKP